jgi:hypothetical protein
MGQLLNPGPSFNHSSSAKFFDMLGYTFHLIYLSAVLTFTKCVGSNIISLQINCVFIKSSV